MYTIPKETLTKVLSGFRTLKLTKAKLPVLQCLKLEVKGRRVCFTGNNLDEVLRCEIQSGKASLDSRPLPVPVSTLQEAVKAADKKTDIVIEPGRLRIQVGETQMARSFEEIETSEFPSSGGDRSDRDLVLQPAVIEAMGEARIAASDDPAKWVLQGVHLTGSTVVATNGRRLYVRTLERADRLSGLGEEGILFPNAPALNLFKPDRTARLQLIRDAGEKDAEPRYGRAILSQGAWSWSGKLIEGKYPNWRQVLPKEGSLVTRITFSEKDAGKLREVLPKLPESKDSHAPIDLRVEGNRVHISAGGGESANTVTVTGSKVAGPTVAIRFNRRFFGDALAQGFRQMGIRDELSPVLMEDKEQKRLHLWMPLAPPEPVRQSASGNRTHTEAPETESPKEAVAETGASSTEERKPEPMAERTTANGTTRKDPDNTRNGHGTDPAARAQEAVNRLRELLRELQGTVQQVNSALKENVRERRNLEKEHQSLRRNLKGLKSLEL